MSPQGYKSVEEYEAMTREYERRAEEAIENYRRDINERYIGWVLLWIGVTVAFICAFAYGWVNQ